MNGHFYCLKSDSQPSSMCDFYSQENLSNLTICLAHLPQQGTSVTALSGGLGTTKVSFQINPSLYASVKQILTLDSTAL